MARILLAEDDENMRIFLARALERAGHEVSAVGDGDAALALAGTADFDLLLADVVMPGIDGIELARRVSALLPELRIMFITGFAAVALNQPGFARRGFSPSPSICASSSRRSTRCWPPESPAAGRKTAARRLPEAGNSVKPGAPFAAVVARARSSAGEHYLDMVGVTGSIPVAPTTIPLDFARFLAKRPAASWAC